jgi:DNA-directed RNA polymerase specialized sigma24 family protein
MTWNEMITKRREKESVFAHPYDSRVSCIVYQRNFERALNHLSPLEQNAIRMRFVQPQPIARVADRMGMSWDGADELIDRAVVKIRRSFSKKSVGDAA